MSEDCYIIKRPSVVSFYNTIKNNHILLDLFETTIENFCSTIINFTETQKSNEEKHLIISTLFSNISKEFEKQNKLIDDKLSSQFTILNSNLESFLYKFKPELFISSIQDIITNNSKSIDELKIFIFENFEKQIKNIELPTNDKILFECMSKLTILSDKMNTLQTSVFNHNKNDIDKILTELKFTIDSKITSFHSTLNMDISLLKNTVDSQISKIDSIDKTINKNQQNSFIKGQVSQSNIYEIINKELSPDGYELIDVSKIPNSGDFILTRSHYPDIILESKDYTTTVPSVEVDKFKKDCSIQNKHGIMISLSSNIAKKSNPLDFEFLPNNKCLIYIPNNNYDILIIKRMIHFIYLIDSKMSHYDTNIIIPIANKNLIIKTLTENISIIKELENQIKIFQSSVNQLKTNLPSLENLIFNTQTTTASTSSYTNTLVCSLCNKTYKKKHTCSNIKPLTKSSSVSKKNTMDNFLSDNQSIDIKSVDIEKILAKYS